VDPLMRLLIIKKDAILGRWLDRALDVYAADKAHFLKQESDRFRNPVGHAHKESLSAVLEALLAGRPAGESLAALDAVVRIRAVQDLTPAQAVSFVPLLKEVLREEVKGGRPRIDAETDGLAEIEARIDELSNLASDLYGGCRDQIARIKANERLRRTYVMERACR
jgi:hypothetical protein